MQNLSYQQYQTHDARDLPQHSQSLVRFSNPISTVYVFLSKLPCFISLVLLNNASTYIGPSLFITPTIIRACVVYPQQFETRPAFSLYVSKVNWKAQI